MTISKKTEQKVLSFGKVDLKMQLFRSAFSCISSRAVIVLSSCSYVRAWYCLRQGSPASTNVLDLGIQPYLFVYVKGSEKLPVFM